MEMEQKTLISELNQGKELANQLWRYLQPSPSQEAATVLKKILSSYEKALSVLNALASEEQTKPSICFRKEVFKKRKLTTNWSEQVKVCSAAGLEGPVEDGYCWRKYGQKEILGARFPRGYFRCSHRFAQGCLATKQVQRSDEDPSIFEITYKGQHTCNQILHPAAKQPAEESPKEALIHHEKPPNHQNPPIPKQPESQDSCLTQDPDDIRVKSENLPFCFPSQSNIRPEIRIQPSIFPENLMENEFAGSSSQSSSESQSNYFFGLWPDTDQTFGESGEFISVPSVSIGDLEEYCAFDNLEFFY